MHCLDLTLPTPAENLACDEALLDFCEAGRGPELLRFWEPPGPFVVIGYANRVSAEVDRAACQSANVPILRRCTGGGTVLQAPGCLNYSLLLRIDGAEALRGIHSTNRFILERHAAAAAALIGKPVEAQGHTDLAVGGRKCSGNAQRRRRRFLLFHGTFLLNLDIGLIEALLPMPSQQPAYRNNRVHRDFLTNLAVPADALKRALMEAWSATEPFEGFPLAAAASLARDKYETDAWNFRL
jgi:lipoate-protein ligase A